MGARPVRVAKQKQVILVPIVKVQNRGQFAAQCITLSLNFKHKVKMASVYSKEFVLNIWLSKHIRTDSSNLILIRSLVEKVRHIVFRPKNSQNLSLIFSHHITVKFHTLPSKCQVYARAFICYQQIPSVYSRACRRSVPWCDVLGVGYTIYRQ